MSASVGTDQEKNPPSMEKGSFEVDEAIHSPPHHEVSFPEGGWRAWSVVLGVYTNAHGVYNGK
ncbi:hypothetical protein H0H87_010411 [Tephrocybe sp. NHM501043]|nr:hypothetical protein H0H87_010411 [Tephrocybe sp. NHM501043]